jgi:tetratricopeptide (TPR) repeat protein
MAKKKNTQTPVSQEENVQAQQMLEQYHQIANDLHVSKDQEQTETVLAAINTMPEGAQIALLKALSKQHHADAADILSALHELSPLKPVRKEARRSLIQLEGARIYPQWQLPIDRTPPVSLVQSNANPPRFWKGLVSDTSAIGQVQLLLFWEQGEDYKEIRILGFYLEFEDVGVKDFFTAIDNKRNVEKFTAQMAAKIPDVTMRNCSLVEARRLLLLALKVHALDGTKPPFEYQSHLSLINRLVMESDTVIDLNEMLGEEEEEEEDFDLHDLSPKDVVVNFIQFWVDEDYDLAYDLLASDSPLREGLSRDEWAERRQTWAYEAVPDVLEPNFLYEREQPKSVIWLPTSVTADYAATHKEVVVGWSIELDEIPEGDSLPELPQATLVYEETKRHWFWTSYTLTQDDGEWRIQQMTDEGANAQNLSVEELQEKTEELDSQLKEVAERLTSEEVMELEDEEAMDSLGKLVMRIMEATSYTDVLIKKLPLDRSLYIDVASRMVAIAQYERCLAYLIPLTQRFPEERGLYLRRMAEVQQRLSDLYFRRDDEERGELYLDLAEKSLYDSLDVENSFEAHLSLGEMFIDDDERLDEAENHLLQAKELVTDPEEEAHVEMHLGEIAKEREQYQEALSHYQRVLELQPDSSEAWFDIGETHEALGHFAEAETNYKRAIELEPDATGYYYTLSKLYEENDEPSKAIEAIEQGLAANPDSVPLHIYMVAIHIESGDYDQAESFLEQAEDLDPESELVVKYRQILDLSKQRQAYRARQLNKPFKQKKKRR